MRLPLIEITDRRAATVGAHATNDVDGDECRERTESKRDGILASSIRDQSRVGGGGRVGGEGDAEKRETKRWGDTGHK